MRTLQLLPRATEDITEIATYLARSSPRASERFLVEVEEFLAALVQAPGVGSLWRTRSKRFAGVRVVTLSHFKKYVVFYRFDSDKLEVLRIVHGARNLTRILYRK